MKNLLFALLGLVSISATAQIKWMSLEEAMEAQKQEPKKIMMDVYTNWCGPCKMLDKSTFANKDLANYVNENYYAVKFNAEGNTPLHYDGREFVNPNFDPAKSNKRNGTHQFTSYMGLRGYPSIVFLDENGGFIMPVTGFLSAQQLELYLKLFDKDAHKEIRTKEDFQEYQRNFKPEFKA